MTITRRTLFPLILALSVATSAVAQSDPRAGAVDRLFAGYDKKDSPGCSVAVIKEGKLVYQHGYGMADLEHNVPIATDSVFYVGSVSKQFTAFAAALLLQEGKLSLDDSIRKYLPEMPEYAAPITLRNLIYHTSGLREYFTALPQSQVRDNLHVLELTSRQPDLLFKPGDGYQYSNTGYTLLAIIIERVAGMPFSRFSDERILKPLGMNDSHFHDDLTRLVKNRSYAYDPRPGGGFVNASPVPNRVGAGGLFTTAGDVFKWDQNLYTDSLGQPGLIKLIETPGKLNDGTTLEAGFGFELRQYRGFKVVEHGGDLAGYRAQFSRFPEKHFSVICLCNYTDIDVQRLVRQIADIYLPR